MSSRAAQQVFFVAAALALWSVVGQARLLALLLCYVAVWGAFQLPAARAGLSRVASTPLLGFAVALSLPGLAFGHRVRKELAQNEGITGLATRTLDRWRLSASPSIAPPLVSGDRPQTFFVQTDGAERLSARLGRNGRELTAQALGRGLFRFDYDPRRDAALAPSDGTLRARLTLDGHLYERDLRAVTPLPHPRWFCVSPDRAWAAVPSEETDELILLGPERRWVRMPTGDGPVDCAFSADHRVLVSHRYEAEEPGLGALWVIDPTGREPTRRIAHDVSLGRIALSQDTGFVRPGESAERARVLVASLGPQPALILLSYPQLEVRARVPLPAPADHLTFGPDADSFVVALRADASLRRFARGSAGYAEVASLRLGRPAVSLARSRDGRHLYIATTDYRPEGTPQLGNHFVQDQILIVEQATLRVLEQRLTARRSDRQSKPGDVDQGGSPMGLHEARDGSLLIAFAGTDELTRSPPIFAERMATESSAVPERASRDTAAQGTVEPERFDLSDTDLHAPHGLAELADGSLLVSSPAYAALGILATGGAGDLGRARIERVTRLAGSDEQLLKSDPDALARRIGERGFYENTRSGIACQSCHIHAQSDQAGYNLGDHRLVPTLPVTGLLGTAPYLRDGSYPRIRDLDDVAQKLYRGYLRDQPGRRLTLEAFVESLPRARNATAVRDLPAERRGYDAFIKAHCARCHPPPAFTNLGQLPMQALFPKEAAALPPDEVLDVPALLSLATDPPYLNDGRAKTLAEVIEKFNTDNLHGDTRSLSQSERYDLLAFLNSL